ncbi:MAG: hypothetical protein IIB44_06715 [Candidatus Marinimicrobia bacterium]|nr:hypothetical protein [Candidatus Neomarinimicrobiota bacterium]
MSAKDKVQAFQRKLYRKAKQEKDFRFYSLYDKVYSKDVLLRAFDQVRGNKGGMGVDGVTIETYGKELEQNIHELQRELINETYRPAPLSECIFLNRMVVNVHWEFRQCVIE